MPVHFARQEHVTLEDRLSGRVQLQLKFVDVGMESPRHHLRWPGEAQPGEQGAGDLLARIGITAGRRPGDVVQDLVSPADAVADRAGELIGEQEQVDDPFDADLAAMDPAVAGVGAAGAQDRAPLQRFQGRIPGGRLCLGADVEEAARHVRPFEETAQLQEVPSLVTGERRIGDAVEEHRGRDDLLIVGLRETFQQLEPLGRGHEEVERVDLGPHLVRDLVADRARVLAGQADAGQDRVRIAEIEGQETGDVAELRLGVERPEGALHRGGRQHRRPVFVRGAPAERLVIEQHLFGDADEARQVLGPFHLTGHPVLVVGDP
jgi:hypothetical protein